MIWQAVFIGIIATAVMDLIALVQRRVYGTLGLNYALVGRWLGHLPAGKLVHRKISDSTAIPGEAVIGWAAHYLTGLLFAAIFLALTGPGAFFATLPFAALFFGAVTVAAPFLILQPGMGAGLAARHMPSPWAARARSLFAHVTFGLGLWLGQALFAALGGR